MNCPYNVKICKECKKLLIAHSLNFYKDKHGKYGFKSKCKKCKRKYDEKHYEENKEYYKEHSRNYYEEHREYYLELNEKYKEEHKEEILEYSRNYYEEHREHYEEYRKENKEKYQECSKKHYEENKEKYQEKHRQYYQENKEYYKEYRKQHYINNPHMYFNYNNKRRQLEENQGNGVTNEQLHEMYKFFNGECAYSGIKLKKGVNKSIDHIVALDNGGLNEIWNCVPMVKSYNSSKGTRDMIEWYRQQEYFSEERLNKIYAWIEYAYKKWK